MSFFGRLMGTQKAVDNILDKDSGLLKSFGGWVDDFNYTDEERAAANKDKREWGIRQLSALEPFKVVQRILAFSATIMWLMVGFSVLIALWVEGFATEQQLVDGKVVYINSVNLVGPMLEFAFSKYVIWPVITVYSLYFSGGVIDSIKRKKDD